MKCVITVGGAQVPSSKVITFEGVSSNMCNGVHRYDYCTTAPIKTQIKKME